jgi:hypothetical protein
MSDLIIYNTPVGKSSIALYAKDGSLWLNQNQIAELFATSKQNIGQHVSGILKESELDVDSVVKNYFTTAADGKNYHVTYEFSKQENFARERNGIKRPKWNSNLGYTTVVFPGVAVTAKSNDAVNDAVSDAVKKGHINAVSDAVSDALIDAVKVILKLNEGASIKDIMDATGKSNATVKRYLQLLREINFIEFKGSTKTGRYFLTNQAVKKTKGKK